MSKEKVKLNVEIPKELIKKLREMAEENDVFFDDLIYELLIFGYIADPYHRSERADRLRQP